MGHLLNLIRNLYEENLKTNITLSNKKTECFPSNLRDQASISFSLLLLFNFILESLASAIRQEKEKVIQRRKKQKLSLFFNVEKSQAFYQINGYSSGSLHDAKTTSKYYYFCIPKIYKNCTRPVTELYKTVRK